MVVFSFPFQAPRQSGVFHSVRHYAQSSIGCPVAFAPFAQNCVKLQSFTVVPAMPAYPSKRRRHEPRLSGAPLSPDVDEVEPTLRTGAIPTHHETHRSSREPQSLSSGPNTASCDELEVLSVRSTSPTFRTGNLTRIRMQNFLTFSDTTVIPGPRMNLVIGPNGSGKSTVVSAVCIVFGGKPTLLGRNPDLGSYVKFGCSHANVEVWIYEPDSKIGHVSVRRIFDTDGKGKFFIDDRQVRQQDVYDKIIQKYDIQLDNLTQFMPQEKVAEFTNLRPDELLNLAIRALGGVDREEAYNDLLDKDKALTNTVEKLRHSEAILAELIEKQEADSAEVQAFRQQKELMQKLKLLKALRPCVRELELRAEYNEVREELKVVEEAMQEMSSKLQGNSAGPINAFKQKVDAARSAHTESKHIAQILDSKVNQEAQDIEEFGAQLAQKAKQFNDIEHEAHRLHRDVEIKKRNWILARDALRTFGNVTEESFGEEKFALEQQISEIRQRMLQEEDKKSPLSAEIRRSDTSLSILSRRLEGLMDIRKQRLLMVNGLKNGPKVLQCAQLIDELISCGSFSRNAYGPVCVEIEVRDRYHARIMEHAAGGYLMTSFIFESMEDSRVFINAARRRIDGYSPVSITTPLTSNDDIDHNAIERQKIQRPVDERLQRLGIIATVSDIYSAPPSVRAALNAMAGLHTIYVGNEEAVPNQDALRFEPSVSTWYTPESRCMVSSSNYDPRARNTRVDTDFVNVSGKMYNGSVRETEQQRETIKKSIREEESKKVVLAEKMSVISGELKELGENMSVLDEKLREIQIRRNKYRDTNAEVIAKQRSYEQVKDKAARNDTASEKQRKAGELQKMQRKAAQKASELVSVVQRLFDAISGMDDTMTKLVSTERNLAEEESKYDHLKNEILEKKEAKRVLKQKRDEIKDNWRKEKELADNCLSSEQWRDHGDFLRPSLEASSNDLEERIAEMQGQIQGLMTGGQTVVQEYEHRQRKIDKLGEEVQRSKQVLSKEQEDMGAKRVEFIQWLKDGIERMRQKFSLLYRRLGCSGDIRLSHVDTGCLKDLELEVLVSYRKEVELRPVNAMSNSGGEKMCCTMIFCFSLQLEEQRIPPFVMVDELNQGLDPTNEMKIMTMMIEDASKEKGSQSFVVTPKLLPDLPLTSCTKSHIVFNGPVKGGDDFLAGGS